MSKYTESNACSACARSKRRCCRQMPSCARCAERGIRCSYPFSRSRAAILSRPLPPHVMVESVLSIENVSSVEVSGKTSSPSADSTLADDLTLVSVFPATDSDFAISSSPIQPHSPSVTQSDWFCAPGTWEMTHRLGTLATSTPIGEECMMKFTAVLQTWLERWINTGSNPFIHSSLYSANFPACAQVAYATLASYVHRTPANTHTVLRIVEERSNDLLRENGAFPEKIGTDKWADREEQDSDLFAQLARLHALVVYQIIGLFDGDIRSRHVAEGHMAVGNSWANRLFRLADKTLSNTQVAATCLVGSLPTPSTYSQQQWYLWILSESIRRTRLVAVSTNSIFSLLQRRWSACPGGTMYTDHSGLWSAPNATEWERKCLERNSNTLQRFGSASIFDKMKPAEVDEFGTAMLDMAFSQEILEKWRHQSLDISQSRPVVHY